MSANSRWGGWAQDQVDQQKEHYKTLMNVEIPEFVFAVVYQRSKQGNGSDRRAFVSITPEDIRQAVISLDVDAVTTSVSQAIATKLAADKHSSAAVRDYGIDAILSATLLPPDGDVLNKMFKAEG
jgi:hypothetical protein